MDEYADRAAALAHWIQNTDWILVSDVKLEELPAYGKSVLVSDGVEVAYCFRGETDKDGHHWYLDGDHGDSDSEFSDVTHFMIGPPPPPSVKYKK